MPQDWWSTGWDRLVVGDAEEWAVGVWILDHVSVCSPFSCSVAVWYSLSDMLYSGDLQARGMWGKSPLWIQRLSWEQRNSCGLGMYGWKSIRRNWWLKKKRQPSLDSKRCMKANPSGVCSHSWSWGRASLSVGRQSVGKQELLETKFTF